MSLRKMIFAAALAASMILATVADAAPIMRNFIVTSLFASGPDLVVQQQFTLTFDPATTGISYSSVNNYAYNGSDQPLANSPTLTRTDKPSLNFTLVRLFYSPSGGGFGPNDFGYVLSLNFDGSGNATHTNDHLSYANGTGAYFDSFVTVSQDFPVATAAVPEPATWAMMILGVGVAGMMLRRRKANVGSAAGLAFA